LTEIVVALVRLNHNRFNPIEGQSMQVLGLRPDHGRVAVKIFTPSGFRVRDLVNAEVLGNAEISWNGRDDQGKLVASGVYIVVVSGNKLYKLFRIAVLK